MRTRSRSRSRTPSRSRSSPGAARPGGRPLLALLVGLLLAAPAIARAQASPLPLDAFGEGLAASPRGRGGPRLVVALLYDQCRADLLDRFRPVFGRDGFRRLQDGGARFLDCEIPYAHTVTGPGHATWLSGAPPRVHGIVGNSWYDRDVGAPLGCTDDPEVHSVGVPPPGDPASPHRMWTPTLGDVVRAETHGAGRVVAISGKERGAVLPAGRRPTGVYWIDPQSFLMQSSTWYMGALPAWAEAANRARAAALATARRTPWTPLLPDEAYRGTLPAGPADRFPHPVAAADGPVLPPAIDLDSHPFALDGLFDFAEAAVAGEGLGEDDAPDLLVISVSVTDHVGHAFGPDSPEVLDMYARADRRLAAFLRFLDRRLGRGNYVVSLTADHGVSPSEDVARAFAAAPPDSVGGFDSAMLGGWMTGVLERYAGRTLDAEGRKRGFARAISGNDVVLSDSMLAVVGLDRERAARVLADSAHVNPWLVGGYTAEELRDDEGGDAVRHRYAQSWYPGRTGDVSFVMRPFVFVGRSRTSHGGPWRYDTHVPLLLWGPGVRAGAYPATVSTLDIAPTLAMLLGMPAPAQSEGRALTEALEPATWEPRR
jgi:hypothetical protein